MYGLKLDYIYESNTKNITKSISIHSDYQSVHFW